MLSLTPLAWCALAIAGLMPPLMLMMLSRARDRSEAVYQP